MNIRFFVASPRLHTHRDPSGRPFYASGASGPRAASVRHRSKRAGDWASSRRRSAAAPRPLKRTLSLSAPPLLRHTPFINLAPAPREPDISKGHGPVTASTLGPELSRPGNHDVIKRTARNRPGRGSPGLSTCMSSGRPRLGLQPRRWGKPRVLGSAFRASFSPPPGPVLEQPGAPSDPLPLD